MRYFLMIVPGRKSNHNRRTSNTSCNSSARFKDNLSVGNRSVNLSVDNRSVNLSSDNRSINLSVDNRSVNLSSGSNSAGNNSVCFRTGSTHLPQLRQEDQPKTLQVRLNFFHAIYLFKILNFGKG